MSTEYASESENHELRKRAAWLLGMLVLVAALLVVIVVTFFHTGGGTNNAGPTGSVAITPPSTHTPAKSSARSTPGSGAPTSPSGPTTGATTGPTGPASCPTTQPCIVAGDIGNAIGAINDYRTAHGKPAATGTVTPGAQQCALSNGDTCSGSWAESQVPNGTGAAALQKILSRGHVLTDFTSFEVGWAYDPGSKQYFFALIRTR